MARNSSSQDFNYWDDVLDDDDSFEDDPFGDDDYSSPRNTPDPSNGRTNPVLLVVLCLLAAIVLICAIIIGVKVLPDILNPENEPSQSDIGFGLVTGGSMPQLPSALPTMYPHQGYSQPSNPAGNTGGYTTGNGSTGGYTTGSGSTGGTSTFTTSSSGPSAADVSRFGNEISYPNKRSYLSDYETMYVKSEKGHSIYVFFTSSGGEANRRKNYYCYEGDAVTVLARENGMSCVIFTAGNGETHIGWVASKYLVY